MLTLSIFDKQTKNLEHKNQMRSRPKQVVQFVLTKRRGDIKLLAILHIILHIIVSIISMHHHRFALYAIANPIWDAYMLISSVIQLGYANLVNAAFQSLMGILAVIPWYVFLASLLIGILFLWSAGGKENKARPRPALERKVTCAAFFWYNPAPCQELSILIPQVSNARNSAKPLSLQ